MFRLCLAALLVSFLLLAGQARADSRAVILPPRSETEVTDEAGDKIADYVATYLREVRHLQVTPPLTASEGIPQAARECWTTSCVLQYKQTFNADFAVVIVLFAEDGKFHSFNIVVVVEEDAEYSASEFITSATNLEQASLTALQSALRKRDHGPGPWLRVLADSNNIADDATVEIDGKVVGKIPFIDRVRAGDHYVVVRKDGYQPFRETVSVTAGAGSEEEIHLTLTPIPKPPSTTWWTRARQRRGVADWVVGGVAIGAGATVLASGVYRLSKNGQCAEYSTMDGVRGCSKLYASATGDGLQIGIGSLMALGGGAIIALAPVGYLFHTDHRGTTAALTYSGDF